MTTNSIPTTLSQMVALVQKIEGELEVTAGVQGMVTGEVSQGGTDMASDQLQATEEYDADAVSSAETQVGASVVSGVASGLGALGAGTGASGLLQVGAGITKAGALAASAGCSIKLAVMAEEQGAVQAQQDYYTSGGTMLGAVQKGQQEAGQEVMQGEQTLASDINSVISQYNQASMYQA